MASKEELCSLKVDVPADPKASSSLIKSRSQSQTDDDHSDSETIVDELQPPITPLSPLKPTDDELTTITPLHPTSSQSPSSPSQSPMPNTPGSPPDDDHFDADEKCSTNPIVPPSILTSATQIR